MTTQEYGPQYPARPSTSPPAAGEISIGERLLRITGARPPKIHLAIGTYNARSLARDEGLDLLLEEKKRIRCDVLGVCETRRKNGKEVIWNDGHTIYLGKEEGASNVGGVGFIINKGWSANIESCSIISSRVGILLMKLDSEKTIKFIEVYAPTNASDDREIEEFYQCLDRALTIKSTYTVVMGD